MLPDQQLMALMPSWLQVMRLRDENEALMEPLVRAKVELAETQGEWCPGFMMISSGMIDRLESTWDARHQHEHYSEIADVFDASHRHEHYSEVADAFDAICLPVPCWLPLRVHRSPAVMLALC